jgi:hypothetical protein
MRAFVPGISLALISALSLAACDSPDVGERCVLSWNANWEQDGTPPPPTPLTAQGDYFESGNLSCDDLVCIVSPAPATSKYGSCSGDACGYCSKPCVSDRDCYKSSTGLVCDQVILDPVFIATLDELTKERYLGDIRYTNYCVVPRS